MKKKYIYIIVSIVMTCSLLSGIALAVDIPVNLSLNVINSTINPGDTVIMNGTASGCNYVNIKVLDPEGLVVDLNSVGVNANAFIHKYTLNTNPKVGVYTVVAGIGSVVATTTFRVGAYTADIGLALTTPATDADDTFTGGGVNKTVAASVKLGTNLIVITGTKALTQTIDIGGKDAANITVGGTEIAPTYKVDTSSIASGGSKVFTLTVKEESKISIVYNITATVGNNKLISITLPSAITGVLNGVDKSAVGLGLPTTVAIVTGSGTRMAGVVWDVMTSSYDRTVKTQQNFTVNGTVILPAEVINANNLALTTSISVTVNAVNPTPEATPPVSVNNPTPEATPPVSVNNPTPEATPPANVNNPTPEATPPASVNNPTPEATPPVNVNKPTPEATPPVNVNNPTPEATPPVNVNKPTPKATPPVNVNNPTPKVGVNGEAVLLYTVPKVNTKSKTASIEVDKKSLVSAFDIAVKNVKGVKTAVLEVLKKAGVTIYKTSLPVEFLSTGHKTQQVEIKTAIASVILPSNMLSAKGVLRAKSVFIGVAKVDKARLSKALQNRIGNRPVIELNLTIDGKATTWNNPSAPVKVSLPYKPTAQELANPNNLQVWYIDGKGKATLVSTARYDAKTRMLSFTTTHFSTYAVLYIEKTVTTKVVKPKANVKISNTKIGKATSKTIGKKK